MVTRVSGQLMDNRGGRLLICCVLSAILLIGDVHSGCPKTKPTGCNTTLEKQATCRFSACHSSRDSKCVNNKCTCEEGKKCQWGNEKCCAYGTVGSSCAKCAAGKYANGAADCKSCPAGQSTGGDTGCTACIACAAGNYANAGASKCTTCGTGKYSGSGSGSCSSCDAGRYQPSTGKNASSDCIACGAGKYSSTSAATCNTCAAGSYSETRASRCTFCAPGSVTNTLANASATQCTACEVGQYSNASTVACRMCDPGQYQGSTASTACIVCAPGSITDPTSCASNCSEQSGCIESSTYLPCIGEDRDRLQCKPGRNLPGYAVDHSGSVQRCPHAKTLGANQHITECVDDCKPQPGCFDIEINEPCVDIGNVVPSDRILLFQGEGSAALYQNQWEGWFTDRRVTFGSGTRSDYYTVPVRQLTLSDSAGNFVQYTLSISFAGRTLHSIVTGCMGGARKNNESSAWTHGHCNDVGMLTNSSGVASAAALRIGVGNGCRKDDVADRSSGSGSWGQNSAPSKVSEIESNTNWVLFSVSSSGGDHTGDHPCVWGFGGAGMTNNGHNSEVYIYATSSSVDMLPCKAGANKAGYAVNSSSGIVSRCAHGKTLDANQSQSSCSRSCVTQAGCGDSDSDALCVGAELDKLPCKAGANKAGYAVNSSSGIVSRCTHGKTSKSSSSATEANFSSSGSWTLDENPLASVCFLTCSEQAGCVESITNAMCVGAELDKLPCKAAQHGYSVNLLGLCTEDLNCSAGHFWPNSTRMCKQCASGSVTNTMARPGATSCTKCAVGQFSPKSTDVCRGCNKTGWVTNTLGHPGASTCTGVRPGYFSHNVTHEEACPPGWETNTHRRSGATGCTKCLAGRFSPVGMEPCLPCQPGRYTGDNGGATECTTTEHRRKYGILEESVSIEPNRHAVRAKRRNPMLGRNSRGGASPIMIGKPVLKGNGFGPNGDHVATAGAQQLMAAHAEDSLGGNANEPPTWSVKASARMKKLSTSIAYEDL